MIPKDKYDESSIELLRLASDKEVIENADQLLAWLQDVNWPVFDGVVKRLANLGNELFEPLNTILEGKDSIWKSNIIGHLIPAFSQESQKLYIKPLESILAKFDQQDIEEGVIDYVEIQLLKTASHT